MDEGGSNVVGTAARPRGSNVKLEQVPVVTWGPPCDQNDKTEIYLCGLLLYLDYSFHP